MYIYIKYYNITRANCESESERMKFGKVRLSPVKGRNQIVVTFNKELLKDSDFSEGEYVMIMCEKNKITMIKEDQIKEVNTMSDVNNTMSDVNTARDINTTRDTVMTIAQ